MCILLSSFIRFNPYSICYSCSCLCQHEYERVINEIEKGERKIAEAKQLARAVRVLISIFDNPWEELEFSHVNAKDKNFSLDNDRYLLCWTHKVRKLLHLSVFVLLLSAWPLEWSLLSWLTSLGLFFSFSTVWCRPMAGYQDGNPAQSQVSFWLLPAKLTNRSYW